VDSWEFQFLRVGSNEWEWVLHVEPVDGCEDCFEAKVTLPDAALQIRSRSISGSLESEWSEHLPVYLPEIDIWAGLGFCLFVLLWIAAAKMGGGYYR